MTKKFENVVLVMGWDVGDGDTVVCAQKVGESRIFPLYSHTSKSEQVVKSVVSKRSNGTVLIGDDAAKQRSFQINFKRSPGKWNLLAADKIEYRQHMSDFIHGVSEAILSNSANRIELSSVISIDEKEGARWEPDKVLLAVGCPAAEIWKGGENRKQYEELISKATGIDNVIVVEESRAAIFSLFAPGGLHKEINLQSGVLVLDFGSSTVDATCIIPGKKAIHLSWELGAAQIEKAMLEYISNSGNVQRELAKFANAIGKPVLIDKEECSHAIFQLRGDKEDYYDGKMDGDAMPDQLRLYMIDTNGNQIVDDDREPVSLAILYKITPEMMDYAVGGYRFDVREDNVVVSIGTWKQNCKSFLSTVKQLLENRGVSVHSVVVTGGGSNMPFVVELAGDAFGSDKIIPSASPSHSVVRGLATIAYNSLKEEAVREDVVTEVLERGRIQTNEMMNRIAGNLAGKAYDDAVAALSQSIADAGDRRTYKVGEIQKIIQNALDSSMKQNATNIIGAELKAWEKSDKEIIVDTVNRVADKLYADKALQGMIHIDLAEFSAIMCALDLSDISIDKILKDANIIGKVVGVIISLILGAIWLAIALWVPPLSGLLAVLALGIGVGMTDWLSKRKGIPVPVRSLKRAIRKMGNNRDDELSKMKQTVRKEIETALTAESVYGEDFHKHYTVLEETANRAVDRILLIAEESE